jgi:hypothetical protein
MDKKRLQILKLRLSFTNGTMLVNSDRRFDPENEDNTILQIIGNYLPA